MIKLIFLIATSTPLLKADTIKVHLLPLAVPFNLNYMDDYDSQ